MEFSQFERIVIVVAICILLATLTVIAMTMSKSYSKASAQQAAACPDYWYSSNYKPCDATDFGCCTGSKVAKTDSKGSNCNVVPCDQTTGGCCPDGVTPYSDSATCPTPTPTCYNVNNLGGTCKAAVFTTNEFQGSVGMCNKQKYAKGCKVSWEGVTNVADAC